MGVINLVDDGPADWYVRNYGENGQTITFIFCPNYRMKY